MKKKCIYISKVLFLVLFVLNFVSCSDEEINAVVSIPDAVATINVKVFDGRTGEDITSSTTISGEQELFFPEGLTEEKSVVLEINYNDNSISSEVTILPMNPGAKAIYEVILFLNSNYVFSSELLTVTKTRNYLGDAAHGYFNDAMIFWLENANDYIVCGSYDYLIKNEIQIDNWNLTNEFDGLKHILSSYKNLQNGVIDYAASAWTLYRVYTECYEYIYKYTVKTKNGGYVGDFTISHQQNTIAEFEETPHPSQFPKGGGYEDEANAGGGIFVLE